MTQGGGGRAETRQLGCGSPSPFPAFTLAYTLYLTFTLLRSLSYVHSPAYTHLHSHKMLHALDIETGAAAAAAGETKDANGDAEKGYAEDEGSKEEEEEPPLVYACGALTLAVLLVSYAMLGAATLWIIADLRASECAAPSAAWFTVPALATVAQAATFVTREGFVVSVAETVVSVLDAACCAIVIGAFIFGVSADCITHFSSATLALSIACFVLADQVTRARRT